jgi:membrane-bound lytic murein transglycosylase D
MFLFTRKNILITLSFTIASINAVAQGERYLGSRTKSEDRVETSSYSGPRVYAPKVPNSFSLFGEPIPLDQVEVHDRFDRELIINVYMQGTTLQIIKQMGRWMPMIESRLKQNNIPDDFKYLCVAESALQQAVSKVGASGFWQFMKTTGPSYGLEINDNVDERYNVLKATDAACAYLKDAYARLGSWTAAAASYNCGVGGYNGRASAQGATNFYDVLLPEETNRYIFRIAALKYILENPSRTGFIIEPSDMYKPYKTRSVSVNYSISSLIDFAKQNGTTLKLVKLLNPWMRENSLRNAGGKTYEVLLPNW